MEGLTKWVLIIIGAYVGWRFLNNFLDSRQSYNVQSSNYIDPNFSNTPYGYAGARYGIIGSFGWPGGYVRGSWDGNGDWSGNGDWTGLTGYGSSPWSWRSSRVGLPGGSVRW